MAAGKRIKQVADELGVSKTAIRNYMDDEFRAKYTAKDDKGVITITPDGCKLLSENIGKQSENTEKNNPETGNITIPLSAWQLMEAQLREKDEQLKAKDRQLDAKDQQIADLTAAVKEQAQSINVDRHNTLAGTLQPMLSDGSDKSVWKKLSAWWKKEG